MRSPRVLLAATLLAVAAFACGGAAIAAATKTRAVEPVVTVPPATEIAGPTTLAPVTAPRPPGPLRVVLYGDSLAWESKEAFAQVLDATGRFEWRDRTYGGSAACTWFPDLPGDAAWVPDAVVMVFSGNAIGPCMADATGQPFAGDALVDAYRRDLTTLRTTFPAATPVYLATTPAPVGTTIMPLAGLLRELAGSLPGTYVVDAAAAVTTPAGPSWQLPCTKGEVCGENSTVVVRSPDGVHFCPAGIDAIDGVTGACPTYSPGATRYGWALAAPVVDDLVLRP